jgi:ribosomal protein S27E
MKNRIWAVKCENCRADLYSREVISPPCDEPPPYIGNKDMDIPEDAEIMDTNSKPKTLVMSWVCPNCGFDSLVYNKETTLFECCLNGNNCGAKFALARVMDGLSV